MRQITVLLVALIAFAMLMPVAAGEKPAGAAESGKTCLIEWEQSWDDVVGAAKASSKLIILVITDSAPGTRDRALGEKLWSDPDLAAYIKECFLPLLIETDEPGDHPLAVELGINKFPSILVLDSEKNIIYRLTGLMPPKGLLEILKKAVSSVELENEIEKNDSGVEKFYELAKVYIELGRRKDARRLLEKVCELDAGNENGIKIRALFLLGGIDITDKKFDSAVERFKEVLGLDPEDKHGYRDDVSLQLALIDLYKNEYEAAAEKLEKFIKDFPKSKLLPEAHLHLGYCQYFLKDKDRAEKTFKKLAEEFPESPQGKQAKRMINLIKQMRAAEKRRNTPRRG